MKTKHEQINAEKTRILNAFALNSMAKCRAIAKVARMILLNGPYLLNGVSYEVKAKSLGAGVYELRLEKTA